jgi:hypothetical protein
MIYTPVQIYSGSCLLTTPRVGSDSKLFLIRQVNAELTKMACWLRANKMAVNDGKTRFILFHTKGK